MGNAQKEAVTVKLLPALVLSVLVFAGASIAGAQPVAPAAGSAPYPPPSTETGKGVFVVRCTLSHQRQVDPIVMPGPSGTPSHHLHDFFANRSTDSSSTYSSMIAAGTTCGLRADTAAYWTPSLIAPSGTVVKPRTMFAYFRNKPAKYGTTVAYPPDFRLVAGGHGTFPNTFWNCEGDGNSSTMLRTPPSCGSKMMVLHMRFPNCSDGRTDSSDHRSHVVYAQDERCPASHPIKVPELFLHVRYPVGASGPGYKLADGTVEAHADFWNTWQQSALEGLVRRCLNAGIDCGQQTG